MFNAKAKGSTCWICDECWFNDRKQLVEHIEGKGQGGKAHLKFRRWWVAAGQMEPEDWLDYLKEKNEKEKTAKVALQSDLVALETPSLPIYDEQDVAGATIYDACYMPGPPQMFDDNYVQHQLASDYYTRDLFWQFYQ